MRTKLMNIMSQWPSGGVYLTSELEARGYSRQLLQKYKRSGWIWPVGDGAFAKNGDTPTLFGATSALNLQASVPLHFGGRAALRLQGISHHLALGVVMYDLFHPPTVRIPKWFRSHEWGEKMKVSTHKLSLFGKDFRLGVTEMQLDGHRCFVSSKERAVLEFIHLSRSHEEFLEAQEFVGSLTVLDPNLLQKLLVACTSFKTRRVFLYMAEKENWDWLKRLNLSRIDLGRGPRTIVEKGTYDSKYQITVPKSFLKDADV